jgi:hypothetical protein
MDTLAPTRKFAGDLNHPVGERSGFSDVVAFGAARTNLSSVSWDPGGSDAVDDRGEKDEQAGARE